MKNNFWYKVLHSPSVILEYEPAKRSTYLEVKARFLKFQHDHPKEYLVEFDNEALKILIWRLKEK